MSKIFTKNKHRQMARIALLEILCRIVRSENKIGPIEQRRTDKCCYQPDDNSTVTSTSSSQDVQISTKIIWNYFRLTLSYLQKVIPKVTSWGLPTQTMTVLTNNWRTHLTTGAWATEHISTLTQLHNSKRNILSFPVLRNSHVQLHW